ncbi:unnamed protein product [Mytilus edulis]|uniref:Uncharacterized protein n=1 Tax=Mytilus edulis TaxID=6550 RepID=A0A8S3PZD2_MYTED|nr:unnamed protein product [Mytilus edulis]
MTLQQRSESENMRVLAKILKFVNPDIRVRGSRLVGESAVQIPKVMLVQIGVVNIIVTLEVTIVILQPADTGAVQITAHNVVVTMKASTDDHQYITVNITCKTIQINTMEEIGENSAARIIVGIKTDQQTFWKKIGKIGIASERKTLTPMEVVDANGNVSSNDDVLLKWKSDYADLFNQTGNQVATDRNIPVDHSPAVLTESDFLLTEEIPFEEVFNVVCKSKRGKASGVDNIPADVLYF